MGLLRLYLALCVVAEHSNAVFPWQMHGGTKAVQIFYIISGFYMSMVLSRKYTTIADFYKSRVLRIFPPYYLVLSLVVIWCLGFGTATGNYLSLSSLLTGGDLMMASSGMWLASLTNLTIFGQDATLFLNQDHGHSLSFSMNFLADKAPLSRFLIIPPAWSIAVELAFYLIVPFINGWSTRRLIYLMLACVSCRLVAYVAFGLSHDPWTYRFFPFEISNFVMGMLAFRLYDVESIRCKLASLGDQAKGVRYLLGSVLLLACFCLETKCVGRVGIYITQPFAILFSLLNWPIAVVVLFAWSRDSKLDRIIGDLSFPVYLVHLTVVYTLKELCLKSDFSTISLGPISAILSILIALILNRFLLNPLEARRYKWSTQRNLKPIPKQL